MKDNVRMGVSNGVVGEEEKVRLAAASIYLCKTCTV